MGEFTVEAFIDRPADEVWLVVSDPVSIGDWMPAMAGATAEGNTRYLELASGDGTLTEVIVRSDDEARHFEYSITAGPLPIERHVAWMEVHADGEGSRVVWYTEVVPDELAEVIRPLLEGGIAGLKESLE